MVKNKYISRFVSCFIFSNYGNVHGKEEKRMDKKKIGEFLKVLRKEKGLTQEQLAEIFLVSGRTISRWETGMNIPELSMLIQMAEFFAVRQPFYLSVVLLMLE